jgi:TonB family protein
LFRHLSFENGVNTMNTRLKKIVSASCALSLIMLPSGNLTVSAQQDKENRRIVERSESQKVIIINGNNISGEAGVSIQSPPPPPPPSSMMDGNAGVFISGFPGAVGSETFQFVSSEMSFTSSLVKGAPYSADAVTESVQTLMDGNRIVQRSTSRTFRDSEGRTRREQTLGNIGPLSSAGEPVKIILINDPVEGVNYVLHPDRNEASKTMFHIGGVGNGAIFFQGSVVHPTSTAKQSAVNLQALQEMAVKRTQPAYPAIAKAAGAQGTVVVNLQVNEHGDVIAARAVSGHPLLRDAAQDAARQWKFKAAQNHGQPAKTQGIITFNFTLSNSASETKPEWTSESGSSYSYSFSSQNGSEPQVMLKRMSENSTAVKKESLGKQMMEGVEVEGTRLTRSIPAGEIGNEKQIDIVTEIWRSPELQVDVSRRTTDPRSGESVYKLTNIVRAEPDASLFKLPEGYTVKENKGFIFNSRPRQKRED